MPPDDAPGTMLVADTIEHPPSLVQVIFDGLTLDQKIGQLLMVSLNRSTPVDTLQDLVATGQVTGVLLLDNGWGASAVQDVTAALRQQAGRIGLYIAVDQEGGKVQRLSGKGFDKIPSASTQGTWPSDKLTESAQAWASQLSAAGVNLNLAPVADTVPASMLHKNKPIGMLSRQFGTNPAVVAEHAAAFIQGMNAGGVQACVKHFPGLGRITGNTDNSTKDITDGTTTRDSDYLQAFRTAMAAGPAMVMMSLATYSKIDAKHPAVFSHTMITDVLRGDLGWDGVVISDALNAAAVKSVPVGQRAVQFIEAGGDIALFATVAEVNQAASALKQRAQSDEAFADLIDASVMRVLKAKAAAGLLS